MTNSKAQKIFVNRDDEGALIAEAVLDSASKEIVVSIPKFSRFVLSPNNFSLLKKAADVLGKKITIESVDEEVLELAKSSGLETDNAFFGHAESPKIKQVDPQATFVSSRSSATDLASEIEARFGPEDGGGKGWRSKLKRVVIFAAILAATGGATFAVLFVLPRANISITAQKTNFAYADAVIADRAVREVDSVAMKIPGQVFIEKKNISQLFPATSKKNVSKKAVGKILAWNAYSSESQKLVATTRFITEDGHVFRLDEAVTVPAAKIVDGKIVPASVEVSVTADKPGEEYNIAPNRFSIPGFKGTPRYAAFYGESKDSMKGGYVGEVSYPSDEDIKKAKAAAAKTLEEAARIVVVGNIPGDFKMVENSFLFKVVKQTVNTDVNSDGQFSIFAEGEMSVMVFREEDVKSALQKRIAEEAGEDFIIKNEDLKYGVARVDIEAGRMSIPIDFKAVLAKKIDLDELKPQIYGKSGRDLKAFLLGISGLEQAQVSFWPAWVGSVPSDSSKVKIAVD